jgi:hypothetical protein
MRTGLSAPAVERAADLDVNAARIRRHRSAPLVPKDKAISRDQITCRSAEIARACITEAR